MPFMIGKSPVRRTMRYLNRCTIYFRENVKIFSVHCNDKGDHHQGARDFLFWHLCQIQFKNPTVQCVTLRNLTPSPCIKVYFDNREPLMIDLESRTRPEIYNHLLNLSVITKTSKEKTQESSLLNRNNPNYFGVGCIRHCLCEVNGQMTCPSVIPMPHNWRGIKKDPGLEVPEHIVKWGLQTLNRLEEE